MDQLERLASSPFVALLVAFIVCIFLYRLFIDERRDHRADNEKHWGIIGTLTDGLRDNNAITSRALDSVERMSGGGRAS